jgi:hypothetical protein
MASASKPGHLGIRAREIGSTLSLSQRLGLGPNRPRLSIVIAAYDMDRVLPRTLRSLSADYQRHVRIADYEVIVVDNGSPKPIDRSIFTGLTGQFRLIRIDNAPKSPAAALNAGVKAARADDIGLMIDGGRIVTPGLIHSALHGVNLYPQALVASLGWYLGHDLQGRAMDAGFGPQDEDRLLADIDWPRDGYRLFDIGTFDESSLDGWFYPINESNSLFLSKARFQKLGGLDVAFDHPGGGLVNLDFFARAASEPDCELVIMLGEATFHQMHGGVSTNAPLAQQQANWDLWHSQYIGLRGHEFSPPDPPRTYIGRLPKSVLPRFARSLIKPSIPLAPAQAMGRTLLPILGENFDPEIWTDGVPDTRASDSAVSDVIALAHHYFGQGAGATAHALCALALSVDRNQAEAKRICALTAQDRPAPQDLGQHHAAIGQALQILGRIDAAIVAFAYALEIDFDCTPARWALAHLRLPGPDYLDLLARLHQWLQPKLYLEVGIFEGRSIALAQSPSLAIGIDPAPKILHGLNAPTIILPRTSDAQFSLEDPSADWGGGRINFGFVDGLHVFEQALRDFSYLERVSAPGAIIALHDTIPFDRLSAEADRSTQFHTGDVWRIVPYLSALRPDLVIMTVRTPPSGLTLITNLNHNFNWAPHIEAQALAQVTLPDFDDQLRDPTGILRLIENDWAVITAALSPHVGRAAL